MQTLILTSSGQFITTHDVDAYLPKKISDCKIAYITTAGDKVQDRSYLERHKEKMDALGWDYSEYDIAGKSVNDLRAFFQDKDIIMVEGGNTYYLLKVVRESGFAEALQESLNRGVVYIGSSAGSYIACPSITIADLSRQNFDRCGVTDYAAMNLVPFFMKAHYEPLDRDRVQHKAKELGKPLYALTDAQALLVRDGEVTCLGEGECTVF